jgi:hypothetical protein
MPCCRVVDAMRCRVDAVSMQQQAAWYANDMACGGALVCGLRPSARTGGAFRRCVSEVRCFTHGRGSAAEVMMLSRMLSLSTVECLIDSMRTFKRVSDRLIVYESDSDRVE